MIRKRDMDALQAQELGRQFRKGLITEDQYDAALLALVTPEERAMIRRRDWVTRDCFMEMEAQLERLERQFRKGLITEDQYHTAFLGLVLPEEGALARFLNPQAKPGPSDNAVVEDCRQLKFFA